REGTAGLVDDVLVMAKREVAHRPVDPIQEKAVAEAGGFIERGRVDRPLQLCRVLQRAGETGVRLGVGAVVPAIRVGLEPQPRLRLRAELQVLLERTLEELGRATRLGRNLVRGGRLGCGARRTRRNTADGRRDDEPEGKKLGTGHGPSQRAGSPRCGEAFLRLLSWRRSLPAARLKATRLTVPVGTRHFAV